MAEKATWSVDIFSPKANDQTIDAMVLAGDKLFLAGSGGELRALSKTDGKLLADRALSRLLKDDWPRTLEELEERGG